MAWTPDELRQLGEHTIATYHAPGQTRCQCGQAEPCTERARIQRDVDAITPGGVWPPSRRRPVQPTERPRE